jgi:hypothetical protein
VVQCDSHLPPLLNLAELILADISASNTTGSQGAILEECRILVEEKPIDHALSQRLTIALFSLLIVSIVTNVISLVVSIGQSGFGKVVFVPLLLDALLLAVCIGIYIGILQYEVGGYLPDEENFKVPGTAVLGIGFWMLVAMFGCRLVSHPALLVGFLLLLFLIPLMFLILLSIMFDCVDFTTPFTSIVVFY